MITSLKPLLTGLFFFAQSISFLPDATEEKELTRLGYTVFENFEKVSSNEILSGFIQIIVHFSECNNSIFREKKYGVVFFPTLWVSLWLPMTWQIVPPFTMFSWPPGIPVLLLFVSPESLFVSLFPSSFLPPRSLCYFLKYYKSSKVARGFSSYGIRLTNN